MKRLLSIELQKIWKNRAGKILIIAYFVILSFIALISMVEFNIGGAVFKIADQGIFNFPYIWHFNTYIAAILKIFLAIVIVSMMSNEYSYGTLKQNLIDGLSKKEFILSKFYTVLFFSITSTIFVTILTLFLGLNYSSYTELSIILKDLEYILAYFVKITAFFSFCLFVGIWIKRSAFALGFIIIWSIVEQILYGILGKFVFASRESAYTLVQYFPLESMSNLIKEPFRRMSVIQNIEQSVGGQNVMRNYDIEILPVLAVVAWTVIFVLMSFKLLEKRDL